jgi:elongation factor 1-gamma
MEEFNQKTYQEMQAKLKAMSGGGDAAPASGEKKKKEKKKSEGPEEEMDEAEAALAAEPKSKDPFESMPKGTFNMDDFKRNYSNNETDVSIPYFWEKFDPEAYSIWKCEYKYPEELTQVFMSCNLIGGMMQRLDKLRKNAFGSMCLFGKDHDSTISGIWVWRGQDLAFELSSDWQVDYSSYNWTKLDPADAKTKEDVQKYFAWEGTDASGRPFNQGKIFK